MTTKKVAKKSSPKAETAAAGKGRPARSMPKGAKDPQGGLTAKGRAFFARTEGAHLRPGVKGAADTPEKMVRKGSFLRRHFTHPRGPMQDEHGQPTRLALSAHAWGEPVPRTAADARKLAQKGHELLERYHAIKDGKAAKPAKAKQSPEKATKKQAAKKANKTRLTDQAGTPKKAAATRRAPSAVKKVAVKKTDTKVAGKRAKTLAVKRSSKTSGTASRTTKPAARAKKA